MEDSKKGDDQGDQHDADLGEEGEVEGEEGEVEEAGQDGQHGHLPSKYQNIVWWLFNHMMSW